MLPGPHTRPRPRPAVQVPKGRTDVRIDDFSIEVEQQGANKCYVLQGEAIERFTQVGGAGRPGGCS